MISKIPMYVCICMYGGAYVCVHIYIYMAGMGSYGIMSRVNVQSTAGGKPSFYNYYDKRLNQATVISGSKSRGNFGLGAGNFHGVRKCFPTNCLLVIRETNNCNCTVKKLSSILMV